jgi:glycosyltransferase involved in cell wall biosynthesis
VAPSVRRLGVQPETGETAGKIRGAIQDSSYDWVRDENTRTPNFHYLGSKTLHEVNGIMAQSLFLVHTCKPEGFPNTFLQARFQKKPVVTLDFDAAGYIETHGLGFYAKGDWDAFVSASKNLIEDGAACTAASERAYDFAAGNFSFDRTVDLLEGFLFEILAKKRAA